MQNITLSAPSASIQQARQRYRQRGTTLNIEFRKWLDANEAAEARKRASEYQSIMKKMPKLRIGHKVTREEMNER